MLWVARSKLGRCQSLMMSASSIATSPIVSSSPAAMSSKTARASVTVSGLTV